MVPGGNKAKRLSSVNHTTKTIHHHRHLLNLVHRPNKSMGLTFSIKKIDPLVNKETKYKAIVKY